MNTQKPERIVYIDIVKFVAIWMVCTGHSYYMVDMSQNSILYNWIYSFHMPLFMMLCVFFSLSSFDRPFVKFLKQKNNSAIISCNYYFSTNNIVLFFLIIKI